MNYSIEAQDYQRHLPEIKAAARGLLSTRMPPWLDMRNHHEVVCLNCGGKSNTLGLYNHERTIRRWEFLQIHLFCKSSKRTARNEIL